VLLADGTSRARESVFEYLKRREARAGRRMRITLGPEATGVGWVYAYAAGDTAQAERHLRMPPYKNGGCVRADNRSMRCDVAAIRPQADQRNGAGL